MTIETKEHRPLALPDDAMPHDPQADVATARAALAAEWTASNPQTPEEIAAFYAQSERLAADLDAWHATPMRQEITRMVVHVAKESGAQHIVDIGCGAGHDLRALAAALDTEYVNLTGIEPNSLLREALWADDDLVANVFDSISVRTIIEQADLLVCIDVLEHLPDPETFLADIAERAPVGCLLFEATATFDGGTPLHLAAHRGWRPGRCLEAHGWEVIDRAEEMGDRVRVWRRTALVGRQRQGLLLCAYRGVTNDAMQAIISVTAGAQVGWRLKVKGGDALISRSRSILVTDWWRSTNDDVALMVDDDVYYSPTDADHVVELCRSGLDIVCGAYPVHNGEHMACRMMPGVTRQDFGPGQPPCEIIYAATGFMAFSRRVIDAMVAVLPLCHGTQPWSFHPLFQPMVVDNDEQGGHEWLSEDWGFSELARRLGFRVWLDASVILAHASTIPVTARNMAAIHRALEQR